MATKAQLRKQAAKKKQTIQIAIVGIILILLLVFNATSTELATQISVAEAYEKMADGAFILDVREPSEWVEHHIEGATLIPLGQLADRLDEIPEGQEIVVVCRSGNRSQSGRDILRSAGFDESTSMAGGMNDWIVQGFEYVTGP